MRESERERGGEGESGGRERRERVGGGRERGREGERESCLRTGNGAA